MTPNSKTNIGYRCNGCTGSGQLKLDLHNRTKRQLPLESRIENCKYHDETSINFIHLNIVYVESNLNKLNLIIRNIARQPDNSDK